MKSYVNDMWPGSPQSKDSPAGSGTDRSSRLSSRSRSSSSSASSRAASSHSSRSSASRSRSRSRRRRSRSQTRRRHQRKYRRYSRSYSRSRSRSPGRRYRERLPPRAYRRYYRSRERGRSRSRSPSRGRSHYRRPALGPRGRRYYGFGHMDYPEAHPRWRSRSRSRSHTPLRLSDKDRMELLEIAKANAAKALGTANIELPASLKTALLSKDANYGKQIQSDATKLELSGRFKEDVIKTSNESSSLQRNLPFHSGNSIANPALQKTTKETAGFPKDDEKSQSSYGQWIPIKKGK